MPMSDKESSLDADIPEPEKAKAASNVKKSAKKEAPLPDLSSLNFGPAWAKDKPKKESSPSPRVKDSSRGEQRSHGRKQGDRREARGRRDQSRQSQGGRGRRNDRREQRDRPPVIAPPEGIKARIMPIEEGLDAMAKQISATGRTHSVFDLAWVVLGGLERFHVIFESEKEPLHRSRSDKSLWLTKKECVDNFWNNGSLEKYYDEEVTEVDAPSGNFQSVARCGMSRVLIGPPNHHAYQQTLSDLHREKFSNMPLEKYKQKITMEQGEEVVQEWQESMKKQIRWRPKKLTPEKAEKDGEEVEAPEIEETTPPPVADDSTIILSNRREVEQHFIAHGFEQEYESGQIMSVQANISPKLLSAGLLALQKNTVSEYRRYPGDLASILCRQMSGRHLAVFKWKKRLHCGPARPKHLPSELVMADRPAALFKWVSEHPAGNIDAMWKDLLPKDIDEETRHLWYHDLHWLINEGFVLLFSDGKLHAAKELEKPAAKATPKAADTKSTEPSSKTDVPSSPLKTEKE